MRLKSSVFNIVLTYEIKVNQLSLYL